MIDESALDITLVSSPLAGICKWEVLTDSTVGSDHYPVMCYVGERVVARPNDKIPKWVFGKADWDKFQKISEETLTRINCSADIDEINSQITTATIEAAMESIPRSKNGRNKKLVPWWTEECGQAVKNRNRAFKQVKRTHNMQHLIEYKKTQAVVRRTVRQAKRASWRYFCNTIGRTTPVGEVWGMIRRMGGDRREWEYPVITSEEEVAVTNKAKAEIMTKAFAKIHSSDNLTEEGRRRREITLSQHPGVLDRRETTDKVTD